MQNDTALIFASRCRHEPVVQLLKGRHHHGANEIAE